MNVYAIMFIVILIAWEVLILIVIKILQDNDLEEDMVSFDRQWSAMFIFARFIKKVESPGTRRLYWFILFLLIALLINAVILGIIGGKQIFGGLT